MKKFVINMRQCSSMYNKMYSVYECVYVCVHIYFIIIKCAIPYTRGTREAEVAMYIDVK